MKTLNEEQRNQAALQGRAKYATDMARFFEEGGAPCPQKEAHYIEEAICLAQARVSMAEGKVEELKKLNKAGRLIHDYPSCPERYHATCWACKEIRAAVAELEKLGSPE